MIPKFTHLHVHTHYSLLDGLPKIDELIAYVQKLGMNSVAITDHGALYGAVEFYKKAKKAGVKPIIGVEVYAAIEQLSQKRPNIDDKRYHLVLLAKDERGYKNLVKLVTKSHLEGFYYKPRIDEDLLARHADGLIALSACVKGKIPHLITSNRTEEAAELAVKYQKLFGKDNFYLEIQEHLSIPEQAKTNTALIDFSKKLNIPLVATNDCHYLKPDDADAQDVLMLINTGAKIDDPERLTMKGDDFSVKSPEEMAAFCEKSGAVQAITNTQKVAEMCNFEFKLGETKLPSFETPNQQDPNDYLGKLCYDGLDKKSDQIENKEIAKKRLEYELSVIKGTGFASYFLIVQDFVNWAKQNRIVCGPGRGSAAGSLVSFLLNITEVEPIKYGLLFERFLNPSRISMPDIDLDFTDRRRDEVINYVAEKYGKDKVAQIITFGTMAARAVIRDVGRAMQIPYSFCDQLAKLVPFGLNLEQCIEKVTEFRQLYQTDEQAKKLINIAKKLEGVARHASTHACGVIISNQPLDEIVPLQHPTQNDTSIMTQYEMHSIDDLGLLKMDFLGLKNLTIIENTLARIYKVRGESLDLSQIPMADQKTMELFQKAQTTSVFQLECLAGDTIVSTTTMKKLYEKRHKKNLHSVYLDEGKIHKNKIENVLYSGEKNVFMLIAENGWYIKATKNHFFFTRDGWKQLGNVKLGEEIFIKNKAEHLIYNTCETCGKQISGQKDGQSVFCYKCSAKFYKNPSKKESRKKISKKFSGEGNPMFGKPSPHRKGGFRKDLGHYVRSNWEADFARILNLQKIQYQYEPETFEIKLKNGKAVHYTPDFYVPSKKTFYEIKGWMHQLDQEKIEGFQEQYPQYNFILINTTKFAEFAFQYKNLVEWECPQIPTEDQFHFVKAKAIKYIGKEKTYDIVMRSPGNNFVANGFLVHNSSGMKRYLKELRPTDFDDIVAMIALYRPGPMQFLPDYIERKNKRKPVEYMHPKLKPILEKTQGICIYQEQLMQIARDVAGFSLSEADILRKAIGKKIPELLKAQKDKFVEGVVKNGATKSVGEKLWEWILPFAQYGFNKSHSVAYGMIAWQTAFLKAHYPVEFMAAVLTSEKNDVEKISFVIDECKQMGIEVLAPDINESYRNFSVTPDVAKIRFGLLAIKNVGENIVTAILEERKNNGPFQSFSDFTSRIESKDFNKKSLESLIKAGTFDKFEERSILLSNIEEVLNFNREIRKAKSSAQASLFGLSDTTAPVLRLASADIIPSKQKILWEKELLGLFISAHPLDSIKYILRDRTMPLKELKDNVFYNTIRVGGIISSVKKIITKKGQPMIFMQLEDLTDKAEVVVFPSILEANPEIFQENKIVLITGKKDVRDGEPKIIAQLVEEILEA